MAGDDESASESENKAGQIDRPEGRVGGREVGRKTGTERGRLKINDYLYVSE